MRIELKQVLFPQPKSKIKAGDGKAEGKYKFFTSSPIQSKFVDEANYDKPSLIFGTGGNASVHFCNEPFSTSTDCLVMYGRSQIELETIYNYLKSNIGILENGFKGAGLKHISKEYILAIEIELPSEEIQLEFLQKKRIIDGLIEAKQAQLHLSEELVKSRFIEMFGDLERTTTIARYISELRGGKSLAGTEPCKNKVLKTGAATFGWFDPEQYKYLPADYEPLPEHKVETGDVIISRMNTPELVGACSYVFDAPDDMYYPDRLWKAVLKENTNPIFLWQLLWDRDIRKAIKESSGGTSGTMHNISKTNLLAIKCMDAPIELQNEYAEFVKQTDKSKFEIQKSLEKLEILKKSLMQQYFG